MTCPHCGRDDCYEGWQCPNAPKAPKTAGYNTVVTVQARDGTNRDIAIGERDAAGRPTSVRVCYDEETIGDVISGRRTGVEFLLVWMAEGQGKKLD